MAIVVTTDIEKKAQEYFIVEQLSLFGPELVDELLDAAVEKKLEDTGDLQSSVKQRLDVGNKLGYAFKVSFEDQGRFQDMGVGRGSNKIEDVDTNAVVWGLNSRKKKRRPRKWYTRTVMGQMYRLKSILQYSYSEQTKARIKKRLLEIYPENYFN